MKRKSVKYDVDTGKKAVYEQFCKEHPEVKLSFSQWKEIIYKWNELFFDNLINTGHKFKLPYGFGSLAINKKKNKNFFTNWESGEKFNILPLDFQETRKAGKPIYNFNYHTQGYRCSWKWFKSECRFLLADIYEFNAYRPHSRKLAHYLKHHNYIDRYFNWGAKNSIQEIR